MAVDISFTAAVARVATLADGGLRVTLDLPETAVAAAAQFMECKRTGAYLSVEVKAHLPEPPKPTRVIEQK